MNTQVVEALIEKLKALPPERRAEVEDFIDFLHNRESDQHLADSAVRLVPSSNSNRIRIRQRNTG
jgi:hypothetical protein